MRSSRHRRWRPAATLAAIAAAVWLGGCMASGRLAEQLFGDGSFVAAESVYLDLLEAGRLEGRGKDRALYHLGLIYARPTSPLYDPQKARDYLERLLDRGPKGSYAVYASLVLTLQVQAAELREAASREARRARDLEASLDRLRDEAVRIETEASDRLAQENRLTASIDRLRREISRLSTELREREQELERIKQIDLEGPP